MLSRKRRNYTRSGSTKDEEDYIKYRLARRHSKKVVRTEKVKSMDPVW